MPPRVPPSLRLVESFLNSIDLESGRDDLGSAIQFRGWLTAIGRVTAGDDLTGDDLQFARDVRDALRDEVRDRTGPSPPARGSRSRLNVLAARVGLRAEFTDAGLGLRPFGGGVPAVLGEVLAAAVLADRDGSWARLKICKEDRCQVAFYDRSKNSSRTWCSMSSCGNRAKTRAYRGRRRLVEASAPGR